jgi:riboflavin biosynthesis pyrimidine reductase
VILTKQPNSLPKDAGLFTDAWKNKTLIRDSDDLELILKDLASEHGVLSVMLEAGGKLCAAMLRAGLVDETVIYYAPIICGGTVPAIAAESFSESFKLVNISWQNFGNDLRLRGLIAK